MTSILIDNATVSSVQRALGKAKTRNMALLDIEHAALDRFVEGYLFSEKIIVPDNYKEEFTVARKKLLGYFDAEFLKIAPPVDESLGETAKSLITPWAEAFIEGSDRATFNQYFSQINAFSTFIWEHSSSEFFLVFRAHGVGKDSPLIEALLASPKDNELAKEFKIVAKDGMEVKWDKLSRHVQRMLGVMGWLGHQYIWHQALAAAHDMTYSPHPLRDFFANDFMSRVQIGASSAQLFNNAFSESLTRFKGKLATNLEKLAALPSSIQYNPPNILPGLVRNSSNADAFIENLVNMRSHKHVSQIRSLLGEIRLDADRGDHRKRAKFLGEIESIGDALCAELGVDARFLRLKPPTTVTGISIEGDDAGVKMRLPPLLYRQYFLTRRYRAFIRDVMADIAAPGQYGAMKTKLNSWAWIDDSEDAGGKPFYLKDYSFPSKFHRPLMKSRED